MEPGGEATDLFMSRCRWPSIQPCQAPRGVRSYLGLLRWSRRLQLSPHCVHPSAVPAPSPQTNVLAW